MTGMDYTDDLALFVNIPTQVEFQLYSLEKTAGSIGLHENKTEYMYFK